MARDKWNDKRKQNARENKDANTGTDLDIQIKNSLTKCTKEHHQCKTG